MAPTYVPDSDEEASNRGRQTHALGPKAKNSKRARSKSPGLQPHKRKKTDKTSSESSTSAAPKKPKAGSASLSLEEQSAKNAAAWLSTMERRRAAPVKQELAATIDRIKRSISGAYATFELPKLVKPKVKGAAYKYYGFVCKTCRERVTRKIGASDTSLLLKHQARCELRKHQGTLAKYGITGGGVPSNYQVREYAALWIVEDGRSFGTLDDRYLHKLMPHEVVKMLPHRTTLVKDIAVLYRMTQKAIKMMLLDVVGALHIALDMYQTPNGHDLLGIVLFYPVVKENSLQMERFVLECLQRFAKVLAGKGF
ncbi:timeless [Ceratobasidium sp. AG-Ba]|nr:timeless [Ceratobasidium sp. AG-Ba]